MDTASDPGHAGADREEAGAAFIDAIPVSAGTVLKRELAAKERAAVEADDAA